MIIIALCICILACIGFIIKMQVVNEQLQAVNRNCHQHITYLSTQIPKATHYKSDNSDDMGEIEIKEVGFVFAEDVAELEAQCAELKALNAEMLDIIGLLHHCSDYWSEYYVPIGIVQRMQKVIAQAKGDSNDQP